MSNSPSELVLEKIQRDDEYYLTGGDVIFLVENKLFRVHRFFFERESEKFCDMFRVPMTPGQVQKGVSDTNPFILEDVRSAEFSAFLWVFYNPTFSVYEASVETWTSILRLAHTWGFRHVKDLCVRELELLEIPDIAKIILYQKYDIDKKLLVPAYVALCARDEHLTIEEGRQLGLELSLMLSQARERARAVADGTRCSSPVSLEEPSLNSMVIDVFRLDEPSPPGPDASSSTSSNAGAQSVTGGSTAIFFSSKFDSPSTSQETEEAPPDSSAANDDKRESDEGTEMVLTNEGEPNLISFDENAQTNDSERTGLDERKADGNGGGDDRAEGGLGADSHIASEEIRLEAIGDTSAETGNDVSQSAENNTGENPGGVSSDGSNKQNGNGDTNGDVGRDVGGGEGGNVGGDAGGDVSEDVGIGKDADANDGAVADAGGNDVDAGDNTDAGEDGAGEENASEEVDAVEKDAGKEDAGREGGAVEEIGEGGEQAEQSKNVDVVEEVRTGVKAKTGENAGVDVDAEKEASGGLSEDIHRETNSHPSGITDGSESRAVGANGNGDINEDINGDVGNDGAIDANHDQSENQGDDTVEITVSVTHQEPGNLNGDTDDKGGGSEDIDVDDEDGSEDDDDDDGQRDDRTERYRSEGEEDQYWDFESDFFET